MGPDCPTCAEIGVVCAACAAEVLKKQSPRQYTKSDPAERQRRKDLAAQARLERAVERGITRSDTESACKWTERTRHVATGHAPKHKLAAAYSRRWDIRNDQRFET